MGRRWSAAVATVAMLATLISVMTARPARAQTITARPVATGLNFPAGFTFTPDARIFYGERLTGEVHLLNPRASTDSLFFTITNVRAPGLTGLALHPDYPSTPYLYAYVARTVSGVPHNQIVRLTDRNGIGSAQTVIYSRRAGPDHNGGRLLFGPDRSLYLSSGDYGDPANAQNLANAFGKVLRMTPSGGIPPDNPFPGSRSYAYGMRNPFGFAFDPQTGRLWATDNGPECNDELNLVQRGGNHAWGPSATCSTPPAPPANTNRDGPAPILPQRFYTPSIAPTGVAFCSSCALGSTSGGRLFFGAYNTGEIRRVTLNANRNAVSSQAVVLTHSRGILSLERAPGGVLHFSDAGGIYRLVLA
jgi:glucose/arabinose dehydrogenase